MVFARVDYCIKRPFEVLQVLIFNEKNWKTPLLCIVFL